MTSSEKTRDFCVDSTLTCGLDDDSSDGLIINDLSLEATVLNESEVEISEDS